MRSRAVYLLVFFTLGFYRLGFCQTTRSMERPALAMAVSPKGELAFTLGSQKIADGRWHLSSAAIVPLGLEEMGLGEVVSSTVNVDSPNRVRIADVYAAARADYAITQDGEDVRFKLHLTNQDKTKALARVNLEGLTFHFSHPADGTLTSIHETYLAAKGLSIFHPSLSQPIGGVYARDERFGVGLYSDSEFDAQDLFNAGFERDNIIPAECRLQFFTTRRVPPGGGVDVDVNVRISADTSAAHLLGDYQKDYRRHFPTLLYHADNRPVAAFVGTDKKFITAENPLGYSAPIRRLDSAAGYRAYLRLVGTALQSTDARGVIFWSPGGFREPMYPPDFDQFPRPVRQNIPGLVDGLKIRGLHAGLCARCGDGVIREEGKEPSLYRLSGDNAVDMKTMLDRFGHVMDMGFDMFYLDNFGADGLNDLAILKKVRSAVSPDVQLYTEFCTDMSLPYAGHYCEWQNNGVLWTGPAQYESLRILCPDSIWLCISKAAVRSGRNLRNWD